jgi:peptidoglycan glycosyltransferase
VNTIDSKRGRTRSGAGTGLPAGRSAIRFFGLPLLYALAVLLALLYAVAEVPIRAARRQWRSGNSEKAVTTMLPWAHLHVRPADFDRLLAASYLTLRQPGAARPYLERMSRRPGEWFPIVSTDEVGRALVSNGSYQSVLDFDSAARDRRESAEAPLYRAAASVGLNRLEDARRAFSMVDGSRVEGGRYAALKEAIQLRSGGSFPWVLDRNGGTIAVYKIASGDVVAENSDFAALVNKEAGTLTLEAHAADIGTDAAAMTTLDPVVQKAALAALAGFRGSLVAIDPRTSEILAVASSRGGGPLSDLALESQYEPGSVIKVLTGMNAVNSGLRLTDLFPMKCAGFMLVDRRQFRDWAVHGDLRDVNEALAVSCNVAFARLGLLLGVDRLRSFMAAAGFDREVDLGAYKVPLGKSVGRLFNHFETASYAVGLEHESVNSLHLAMLASMMANRGVLTVPRLITGRKSILGEPVRALPPQTKVTLASPAAAETMISAMESVVTDPRGTGRRAAVDGLRIAMKTGTAGKQENGYQAVIMAFAPSDSPRIAIGMIAEAAGPAEFAGAKIAHDFFTAVKGRLLSADGGKPAVQQADLP